MMKIWAQFSNTPRGIIRAWVCFMRNVGFIIAFSMVLLAGCSPSGQDPAGDLIGIDSNTGAAGLSFSPATLAFSSVVVGQSSAASTVTVTAETALTVSAVTLVDDNYSIVETTCVKALSKNGTCTISVKFNPVTEGVTSGAVTFTITPSSSTTSKNVLYGLSGTGTADDSTPGNVAIAFSPQSLEFGNVTVGQESAIKTAKIYASFTRDIYLNTIAVNNSNYSIVDEDCPDSVTPLVKGTFCSVQVKFAPRAAGSLGSSIKVTYGIAATESNLVAGLVLSGTGVGQLSFDGLESFSGTTTTTTTLNWTDLSGASYYLISSVSGGTATLVATQSAPASSYGLTGLTPATSYTYRVNAINSATTSDGNENDLSVTTDAQGSFTAVADLAIAEGGTGSTPAFTCTDADGNTPSYTQTVQSDGDTNCAINSGKVTCTAVSYKTGHAAWASNISVRCDLNGSSFTNTFAVNVSDTNRAPSLTAIGNQTIIAGAAITGVNADDGGDDNDADSDALLYSCTYGNDQGTAAGTACSSLPNSAYSFDTGTGVLAWTSSTAAAVGNATTIYTFTITASDQQGSPLTDTETFTVTVSPGVALASKPDLIPANSSALSPGVAMTQIDYDNTIASNDTSITYTCHFDTTVDGSVTATAGNECDDDLDTYGTASFNTSTGVFDWTPATSTAAAFEFYVTATLGSATASDLFVAIVRETYTTTNLLSDLTAKYATGTGPATGAANWQDLTSNNYDGTNTSGTWGGAGTVLNPYDFTFDGTSTLLDLNSVVSTMTRVMVNAWVSPSSSASLNDIILSTGGGTANGFVIQQSTFNANKIEVVVGDYVTTMTALAPSGWWRLNESSGAIADSGSGGNNGTRVGATYSVAGGLSFGSDTAMSFDGSGDYITMGDVHEFEITTDFTLSTWVKTTNINGSLITKLDTGGVARGYLLQMSGNGEITFMLRSTSVFPYNIMRVDTTLQGLNDNNWHLITAVWDYDGDTLANNASIYVDGVAQALTTVNNNLTATISTDIPFNIGSRNMAAAEMNGTIDEAAVWNRALSAAEVGQIYTSARGCQSTSAFSDGNWYFVGMLFDGSTLSLNIDGRTECSLSAYASEFQSPSTNLVLGSTAGGANGWAGSVSDVRVHGSSDGSSVGTATEMKTNFDATANRFRQHPISNLPTSGLVLHLDPANYAKGLRFGGTGCGITDWFDLTVNAHNGTLKSFASCGLTTGFNGDGSTGDPYRLVFDGINDYVEIPDHADFAVSPTMSAAMWVKASGGLATNTKIFSQADNGTSNMAWMFGTGQTDGSKFQLYLSEDGSASDRMYTNSSVTAFDNTWHFVAFTWAANTTKLYLDGALDSGASTTTTGSVTGIHNSTVSVLIGAFYTNGTPSSLYTGSVGSAMIWNRTLSASEITQACNATVSRYSGATCN